MEVLDQGFRRKVKFEKIAAKVKSEYSSWGFCQKFDKNEKWRKFENSLTLSIFYRPEFEFSLADILKIQ